MTQIHATMKNYHTKQRQLLLLIVYVKCMHVEVIDPLLWRLGHSWW